LTVKLADAQADNSLWASSARTSTRSGKGEVPMSDITDIDKAEFDNLRAEILFHQTNASAVFGLNIVGMGVGITASGQIGAALLVSAVLSCVLWFRYCDHLMAIFRISAYLHKELRPRLTARLGEPVLGWELFLRSAGRDKNHMPKLPSVDSRIGVLVASVAFILPPPLLTIAFLVQRWSTSVTHDTTIVATAVSLTTLAWLYSVKYGYNVIRWIRATDEWMTNNTTE
jgi:hypothetical protein